MHLAHAKSCRIAQKTAELNRPRKTDDKNERVERFAVAFFYKSECNLSFVGGVFCSDMRDARCSCFAADNTGIERVAFFFMEHFYNMLRAFVVCGNWLIDFFGSKQTDIPTGCEPKYTVFNAKKQREAR